MQLDVEVDGNKDAFARFTYHRPQTTQHWSSKYSTRLDYCNSVHPSATCY